MAGWSATVAASETADVSSGTSVSVSLALRQLCRALLVPEQQLCLIATNRPPLAMGAEAEGFSRLLCEPCLLHETAEQGPAFCQQGAGGRIHSGLFLRGFMEAHKTF